MNRVAKLAQMLEVGYLGLLGFFSSLVVLSMKDVVKAEPLSIFFLELIGIIAFWLTLGHLADTAKRKAGIVAFRLLTLSVTAYAMYIAMSSLS